MSEASLHAQNGYRYQNVTGQNEFRLLALLPGRFDDPIRCTLSAVSLDDEPAYESLSYTWGSPIKTKSLICDGKALGVTSNLFEGLRRLRRIRAVRVLWVDAVCINQNDVEERNQQVLYMARIYKQAKQVIVWLGDSSDGADLVDIPKDQREWVFNTESRHTRHLPASWLAHFNRPWFQRTWIIQEAIFARKITVIHGPKKIPWRDFERIAEDYEELIATPNESASHSGLAINILMIAALADWQWSYRRRKFDGFDAYRLLHETGGCQATDVRDKIYALRGLFPEKLQQRIVPDYTVSIKILLLDVAKAFIEGDNDLSVLDHTFPMSRRPGLPSWVPDLGGESDSWGAAKVDSYLWWDWQRYPSDKISTYVEFGEQNDNSGAMLRVRGIKLARVKFVSDDFITSADDSWESYKAMLVRLFSWYKVLRHHPQFANDPLGRLPTFFDAVLCRQGSEIYALGELERRSHAWRGLAFNFKRYCFRSNLSYIPFDSADEETRKRRSTKAAKAIGYVARFQSNPKNALKSVQKLVRPHAALQKEDVYPTVPAESDAESNSIEGNISSHRTSSDSVSAPSSSLSWSSASDSDAPVTARLWKKSRHFTRHNVKQPVKNWTSFAWNQYVAARDAAAGKQASASSDDSSLNNEDTNVRGSDADSEGESETEDKTTSIPHPSDTGLTEAPKPTDSLAAGPTSKPRPDESPLEKRSMGRKKSPVQSIWVQQRQPTHPCSCTPPDNIDYLHHLTTDEDERIFNPDDTAMLHDKAKNHFQSDYQLPKSIVKKKFGWVEFMGETVLGMFAVDTRETDVVCLLRGLRHPCVLREVEVGRYEWVGGCCLNKMWDWEILESEAGEGGAGVEHLEEICIV